MSVVTIPVNTGRPYEILLGRDLLKDTGKLVREVHKKGEKALIITDSNVGPIYAQTVSKSLKAAGYSVVNIFTFPAGEKSKRLTTISNIYTTLAYKKFDRSDIIIALGGGVTGDMAGFAAATWMRGIPFVQIPTSLLALVDSSIGGKTGVDTPEGKNLVGAFWQPLRVIADIDTLSTLPKYYFTDGMGEVIKSACIADSELFSLLENELQLNSDSLTEIVRRCMLVKSRIVENDEHESGERKLLNFGHTLAHALEKHLNYEGISHGCAVAVGMLAITNASEKNRLTACGTTSRLSALLEKFGLPTESQVPICTYLDNIKLDKKCENGQLDLVLIKQIGSAFCHRITIDTICEFLK